MVFYLLKCIHYSVGRKRRHRNTFQIIPDMPCRYRHNTVDWLRDSEHTERLRILCRARFCHDDRAHSDRIEIFSGKRILHFKSKLSVSFLYHMRRNGIRQMPDAKI